MALVLILFILGLILVIKGGDWFVDSAISIAKLSGLPEIFIGATIVSIATTLPEVIVSATGALDGKTTMSLGNAVGSMICNVGLILGITNLISPSKKLSKIFNIKSLILITYSLILIVFSYNGIINRTESLFLLFLFILFLSFNTFSLKKNKNNDKSIAYEISKQEIIRIASFFIIGILAIILGSNLLIKNGSELARYIGIPEGIIALTLIALGTSLPELVTALTALKKGNSELSVGNILGANILNISLVLGVSGVISPIEILPRNIRFDIPIALLLALLLIVPSMKNKRVSRFQSGVLLTIYVLYIAITAIML